MALQTSNNGRDVTTAHSQQIFECKTTFPSLLEIKRFPFLEPADNPNPQDHNKLVIALDNDS
jgi:hypothetical protein